MAASVLAARAQNVTDLVISEVMPGDSCSVTDSYGRHPAWVEVFNTSHGTVNLGGCYWTDDLNDLTKSPISKTDRRTILGPRQVTLFYEGGDGITGTFYLNFPLRPGTVLYLVSSNGRTVIDSIGIPECLPQGKSMSRFASDVKNMTFGKEQLSTPSPMTVNGTGTAKTRSESIREKDPHGWTLTLTSVTVVFSALFILFALYSLIGRFSTRGFKPWRTRKDSKDMNPEVAAAIAMALEAETSGEIEAAIALALHLHMNGEAHDHESFVLTIRPHLSGWNDKSLSTRKQPHR